MREYDGPISDIRWYTIIRAAVIHGHPQRLMVLNVYH